MTYDRFSLLSLLVAFILSMGVLGPEAQAQICPDPQRLVRRDARLAKHYAVLPAYPRAGDPKPMLSSVRLTYNAQNLANSVVCRYEPELYLLRNGVFKPRGANWFEFREGASHGVSCMSTNINDCAFDILGE